MIVNDQEVWYAKQTVSSNSSSGSIYKQKRLCKLKAISTITDTQWQVLVSPGLLLCTYTFDCIKFWLQYMVHSVCMCSSSKCKTDAERLYINRYNTSLAQLSCCLWTMLVSNDLQNLQDVFWFEECAGNFIWREYCWNSQSQWISRLLSSKIIQKATWI